MPVQRLGFCKCKIEADEPPPQPDAMVEGVDYDIDYRGDSAPDDEPSPQPDALVEGRG